MKDRCEVRWKSVWIAWAALSVILFLSVSACQKKKTPVEIGTEKQIIHMGNHSEPETLDPHLATGVPEHGVIGEIFEGLVAENSRDLSPEPGAAQSWKISRDRKTYTFQLQAEGKWSNGDPVVAQDFADSWHRMLSPQLASRYSYMLHYVKNAKAYNEGKIKDFSQVGVKANGPRELVVTLENPTPFFLNVLQHFSTFAVHRKSIEAEGEFYSRATKWARPGKLVSNGAFRLKEWVLNKKIVVDKNPHYWGAPSVRLAEAHFYPIDSQQTEERMFRSGQLHVTDQIPVTKVAKYQREKSPFLEINPYLGTYYYRLNTRKKPLNDVRVRRALAYSVDRVAITERVTKGGQTPAFHFTPNGTAGFTARANLKYDPAAARRLLEKAGFPGGKGFPKIDILYNSSELHKVVAEAIQQMWKKELGIKVGIYNQDWKVYLNAQREGNYSVSRAAWIGDYPDPNTFLDMWVTNGDQNQTGWSNSEYDRMIAKAARTSGSARFEAFQRAEELLVSEVPIVPIYFYSKVYLKSPDVKGWHPTILDHHPLKDVYLSKDPTTTLTKND